MIITSPMYSDSDAEIDEEAKQAILFKNAVQLLRETDI